jgi:tetratricopeptide (TPR) repeat protein
MRQRRRASGGMGAGRALLVLALAFVFGASTVRAQTADDPQAKMVEKLASDAANAYRAADYQRAVELLERAYQIRQVAALLYNLAKAYDKLGEADKAVELYRRYIDSTDAEPKLRQKAEARVAAYDETHKPKPPVIGNPPIIGQVEPPKVPSETSEQRAVRLWKKGRQRDRIIGLTLMGLGVACALSGVGLSVSASIIHGNYADTIDVESQKRAERDSAKTQALAGDILYGLAAVSAGVGAYFIWRGYHPEKPPRVNAYIVPAVTPTNGGSYGLIVGGRF